MAQDFQIYMVDCVGVILNEIAQGCTQKQVALSYAFAIRTHHAQPPVEVVEWKTINEALVKRWGEKGRERVKKLAWKHFEAPKTEAPTHAG